MFVTWLMLLGGFVLLLAGAEFLVRGSSTLARRMGISPLIVGLTIVSFGTSAPELLVSLKSAFSGHAGIALGNVMGSNILNIALILGLCALIKPIHASRQVIKRATPVMIVFSVITALFLIDRAIARWEGLVLLMLFALYIGYAIYLATHESKAIRKECVATDTKSNVGLQISFILGGLAGLIYGANILVDNGVLLARSYGISETIIGITVIAVGTSLPELAASIVAALKNEMDLALGNIIGSNIFNFGLVLGSTGCVTAFAVPELQLFDIITMLIISIILLPFLRKGYKLSRFEGAIFLTLYGTYMVITLW